MLIRIRRFRRADLDSLMEIEQACFPKAAYPRDMFLELYKACGGLFLVANIGDSMAGSRIDPAKFDTVDVDISCRGG